MRVLNRQIPFGAEVAELSPGNVTPAEGALLRELLSEHRVLVFRDLTLSPEQHMQLMSQIGRVMTEMPDEAAQADPDHMFGKVSFVTTRPDEYISGRDELSYHADYSFYSDGAGEAISLHALEIDGEAAPTIFVDMVKAAQGMPQEMLERLRKLELVKCANFYHNAAQDYGPRYRITHRDLNKDYGNTVSVRPAVVRHPQTGEELVNVCQIFTSHVKGWTYAQSDELFAEIEPWQYRPEYTIRHYWHTGDLVIWDNIALQHARDPLAETATRHLQRVVINPWDVTELQQRTGALFNPRDPVLMPAA
jgi:taurine dioxygenase